MQRAITGFAHDEAGVWIPPELEHAVTPLGPVECFVEFYRRA